jgi:hypothetical protein
MSLITKIIGWLVLAITEIMMLIAFIADSTIRATLIGSQVVVFGAVWASVAWKNHIDLRRDQLNINVSSEEEGKE